MHTAQAHRARSVRRGRARSRSRGPRTAHRHTCTAVSVLQPLAGGQRLQLEICEHPTVACKNTPISSCIVDNAGYKPLPCREGRQPRPRQRVAAPPLRRCRARRQGARRATLARPWQQPVSSFFRLETHRGAGALSLLARRRAVACRLPATARRMSVANRVRARPRAPC